MKIINSNLSLEKKRLRYDKNISSYSKLSPEKKIETNKIYYNNKIKKNNNLILFDDDEDNNIINDNNDDITNVQSMCNR